ncbi:MAG: DUF839 domain-containing protein [Gammaproteobacteria bacterium]|nr:DUF839 domain-containing protein [Gammaproteobacteria bacterium]
MTGFGWSTGVNQPEDSNDSGNPTIGSVVRARLQRRQFLKASVGAVAAGLGPLPLAGCVDDGAHPPRSGPIGDSALGFEAVPKSIADAFVVPPGYTARVLIAVGDPLFDGVAAYRDDGDNPDYARRCGDWHDGMEYFGLSANGRPDPSATDRALLAINHEWVSPAFLHASGPSAPPRPASEVDIETAAMGVTVVEMAKDSQGHFRYLEASPFNRRITTLTEIEISGPLRGHPKLKTRYSPTGTHTRGTINNCGTSRTPWGTLLTGEENWAAFFARDAADADRRSEAENYALARYGRPPGTPQAYQWNTVPDGADPYQRWNTSVTGASQDGHDDYRHEIHGQGYMTEIDPYDPDSVIQKRTALGRFAHEAAAFSRPQAGEPLAVYMGDDSRGEYIYKFVSDAPWDPADALVENRMAVGAKYLDAGKLYAARFHEDGTGEWLLLSKANPAVTDYDRYPFADDGDVLLHARIAADAAGATRMDRPEWSTVNPDNGDVYITLTNNSGRQIDDEDGAIGVDAANPRAYKDRRQDSGTQSGNVNGHIARLAEDNPSSTRFRWDIYLFGAESDADASLINLSGLTADQDFSGPDCIRFGSGTDICWILTDDNAMTDQSNAMMLAATPGQLGDGSFVELDHGETKIVTPVGAQPGPSELKRFMVGPVDQEITGLAETPDGRVLFVNVQHPGAGSPIAGAAGAEGYTSHWPGNMGYGPGGDLARPRSATVMIAKDDGGKIGS